jgi:arylsulfatase A-like enzyme
VEESEYLTDALAREAAAFVTSNKAKSFFLYLAFNAPHTPLQAPDRYLDRVKGIADEKLRKYAAMVCGMDDAVGKLTASLKENQLLENTLIFFFSDNGGPVGVVNCRNTPLRGAKGTVYEGGVRVPFVVSWAAMLKPGIYPHPVSSLDVFPTAMAACGSSAPTGVVLDGVNLLPHLKGEAKNSLETRALYWRTSGGETYAIRKGHHKLLKAGKNPAEVYDLAADVSEKTNLAGTRKDLAAALQKEWDTWNATLIPPKWEPLNEPRKK